MQDQKGSTLTEAALVMPLFIMILFGIIQYGFIFSAYITVVNASAVGARAAKLNGATDPAAKALAEQTASPALTGVVATITNDVGNPLIKICKVDYDMNLFFSLVVPRSVNGVLRITSTTKMS